MARKAFAGSKDNRLGYDPEMARQFKARISLKTDKLSPSSYTIHGFGVTLKSHTPHFTNNDDLIKEAMLSGYLDVYLNQAQIEQKADEEETTEKPSFSGNKKK